MPALSRLALSTSWRFATALTLAACACQRRDGEARVQLSLASDEEWAFATHPQVPLAPDELRDLTRKAFAASSRFAPIPAASRVEDPSLVAHAVAHIVSAEVVAAAAGDAGTPDGGSAEMTVHLRVRVDFTPPLGDEPVSATCGAYARGLPEIASRQAFEAAVGRAVEQTTAQWQGRNKSEQELNADLRASDGARAQVALERLAARRSPIAYAPLLRQLRQEDTDVSLAAMSSLVMLDDSRSVRAIVDEAEHRDLAYLLESLYAIGSLGGPDAEGYLFALESGHFDGRVRQAATEALGLARRRAAATKHERAGVDAGGAN